MLKTTRTFKKLTLYNSTIRSCDCSVPPRSPFSRDGIQLIAGSVPRDSFVPNAPVPLPRKHIFFSAPFQSFHFRSCICPCSSAKRYLGVYLYFVKPQLLVLRASKILNNSFTNSNLHHFVAGGCIVFVPSGMTLSSLVQAISVPSH